MATKYERCDFIKPHERHRWYPHWYSKTRICLGMEEDPWLRANPAIGLRSSPNALRELYGIPEAHKHKYVVARMLIMPDGMPVSRDNVYWQCFDDNCWDIYLMPREALRKELLKKPVYQTWPG